MPLDIFDHFADHLSKCAKLYRSSTEKEIRRTLLSNLFITCDVDEVVLSESQLSHFLAISVDGSSRQTKDHHAFRGIFREITRKHQIHAPESQTMLVMIVMANEMMCLVDL